jgi:UDPglucose--hexose-1-phosphate uridylyltransferase
LDFNLVVHNAPRNSDYHFHIEFYPKLSKFAGVELGTDISVNTVSPETSAKKLRGALK